MVELTKKSRTDGMVELCAVASESKGDAPNISSMERGKRSIGKALARGNSRMSRALRTGFSCSPGAGSVSGPRRIQAYSIFTVQPR